jgi:hypothetical protein
MAGKGTSGDAALPVQRPFMSARPKFPRITSLDPNREMSWNAVIF